MNQETGNTIIFLGIAMLLAPAIIAGIGAIIFLLGQVNWTPKLMFSIFGITYLGVCLLLVRIGAVIYHKHG